MSEHDPIPRISDDEPSNRTAPVTTSGMGARVWAIAYRYRDPSDYGIPTLPEWTVNRTENGGVAFHATSGEPFIRADRPVSIRR